MFHPLMEKLVSEVPGHSVCEFGNQRYGGNGNHKSVKEFYRSIGYDRYVALDVNEEKDAVIADLNHPVQISPTFDLVTNNGTSEHIFDQRQVFENAHNLSHRWMLHVLPLIPWVNHGFFNYNPILFRDLAAANDYAAEISIGNRWGDVVRLPDEEMHREKRPQLLEKACNDLSKRGGVFVIALFEKTGDASFRLPFQGKYKGDIADDGLADTYG